MTESLHDARAGILFILVGMASVTLNDMLIKLLSGGYPLHQLIFARSTIALAILLVVVWRDGGFGLLRTDRPGLHLTRCLLLVVANLTFFTALAAVPLGEATALFFVAPLCIVVLSIPLLGETVGARRLAAVAVGFLGMLVMLRPGIERPDDAPERLLLLLPVVAAVAYALMQILTRRLGASTRASVMSVYIQATFIAVGAGFWVIAGDGRLVDPEDAPSLQFLLRAWTWPEGIDAWIFALLGVNTALFSYCLSQAYRMASAGVVAPFEYTALPMAVFWGWAVWGEVPDPWTACGILLIVGAGLYVYARERQRHRLVASPRAARRG